MEHEGEGQALRIVVGVDGSPSSVAALRWAAGQARLLQGAELAVVRAWQPRSAIMAPYARVSRVPPARQEHAAAAASLAAAVQDVLGPVPDVTVREVLAPGPPAPVLLNCAKDADLLVLGGHRSASPISHTVGGVASACLRNASCPVVIVTASARYPAVSGARARPRDEVAAVVRGQ